MHKNILLIVILLAIVAALVIGVNIGKNVPQDAAIIQPATTITPTTQPKLISYTNPVCGISLSIPDNLEKLESSTSGVMFINTVNTGQSIVIACQPEIPRVPLPPEKIETVQLIATDGGTFAATLYHDASPSDGTPIDKLIFTHPTKNIDVFIAGLGDVFTSVLRSVQILP